MRVRRMAVTAAVALSMIAVGCGGDEEEGTAGGGGGGGESAELPVVKMQGLPADPGAVPMLVMQENGIDEKHGFKAEFVEVDPDAAANTLLLGESDVAMEQDVVNMTLAQDQGEEAVCFLPNLNTMMNVVVPEDSPAQSPEDLIGKKVGHFGVDSGTTSTISLMLQELYDINTFKQYDLREAGPAALPELLKGGRVDAIFDYEPLSTRAILETPGRYLFEPSKAWAERTGGWAPPLTEVCATVKWLEENEETAMAVRDAWIESVKVVEDSGYDLFRDEPYREFLDLRSDDELEAFIKYCADLPCLLTSWTKEDIGHLDEWLKLMAENDVLIKETAKDPVAVRLEDFYSQG